MAEISTLARPYAKAAFDVAKANGQLSGWSAMMRSLASVAALPAVQSLVNHVSLATAQKVSQLTGLCQENMVNGGENLLTTMAENGRLGLLPEVFEQFETLRLAEEKTADVVISTAFALSDAQLKTLSEKLAKKLGREVQVSTELDPSLKGGIIIRFGDTVIDGSVRGRLVKLAEAMNS
ncbi:MAG: F0F1 ATP synthase subunit delta [Natronospirillum sp.]